MELTTKDIIKILPFEEAFKRDLLDRYDNLAPDERYTVEQLLWDLYDEIYTLKLQGKIEAALEPGSTSKFPLDDEFYRNVKQEVDEEMMSESTKLVETVDLQAARDKLQSLIKEPDEK